MRISILAFCCLFATTSFGSESTTDAYLAARDKAIATIGNTAEHESPEISDMRTKRAVESLQPMVRALVGPLDIEGFPYEGRSNVDTLANDEGFGKLDGLMATSLDGNTSVVVSTIPLLHAWLIGHRNWWPGQSDNPPLDIAAALRSEGFYTQALDTDAHVYKFADIPLTLSSEHDIVGAILFEYGQDLVAPNPPNEIAVSVIRSDRVFIFTESTIVDPIPACKIAYERDWKAASTVLATYQAASPKDDALFDKYTRMQDAANDNFEHCFQKQLPFQSYAALTRQAQALIDRSASH
jgi:hypothetical protein